MLEVALGILVFGALIAAIFGQKTAQSFVRFAFCIVFAVIAGFAYFLYKLDKIGGHEPYPGEASLPGTSTPAIASAAPQAAPQQRQVVWIPCPNCGGTGRAACPVCHGTGQNPAMSHEADSNGVPPPVDLGCPNCIGLGTVDCPFCHGQGGHYQ